MNIIINASTCVSGGGIQVSSNIIIECLKNKNIKYYFLVSKEVNDYLIKQNICIKNNITVLQKSPANIFFRNYFKKLIDNIISNFNATLVFTIFGPSYIKFNVKHLVGFADPWVTHPNKYAFKSLDVFESIYRKLLTKYKLYHLRHEKYIWVETDLTKSGLLKKLKIRDENIFVIPNSCNPLYYNRKIIHKFDKKITKIFILTAYYKHKNLEILFPLIKKLIDNNYTNFKFLLTLPDDCLLMKNLNNNKCINKFITNLGPLSVQESINTYIDASIIFLPSLLENISAVYLEAILLNKPFLTTNFNFSRDICGDSCLYFEPMDYEDAYRKLIKLFNDDLLRQKLLLNQKNIKVINPSEKFEYYLNIFNKIL